MSKASAWRARLDSDIQDPTLTTELCLDMPHLSAFVTAWPGGGVGVTFFKAGGASRPITHTEKDTATLIKWLTDTFSAPATAERSEDAAGA